MLDVVFANQIKDDLEQLTVSGAEYHRILRAITELETKSIELLLAEGNVVKLDVRNTDNVYSYRVTINKRIIFTENLGVRYVQHIVDPRVLKTMLNQNNEKMPLLFGRDGLQTIEAHGDLINFKLCDMLDMSLSSRGCLLRLFERVGIVLLLIMAIIPLSIYIVFIAGRDLIIRGIKRIYRK